MKGDIGAALNQSVQLDEGSFEMIVASTRSKISRFQGNVFSRTLKRYIQDKKALRSVKNVLRSNKIPKKQNVHK
ncbi:MAG: hypothetical protein IPH84_17115 [Bacteroidales bacterium]|nr:hypothetical protein [Bacteroidales bacterium]